MRDVIVIIVFRYCYFLMVSDGSWVDVLLSSYQYHVCCQVVWKSSLNCTYCLPRLGHTSDSLLYCRSLNSNSFSGRIPPSIGNLSNLYWLDLADNKLSGTIPVSTKSMPGLDMLLHAKHLYVSVPLCCFHYVGNYFRDDLTMFPLQPFRKQPAIRRDTISAF